MCQQIDSKTNERNASAAAPPIAKKIIRNSINTNIIPCRYQRNTSNYHEKTNRNTPKYHPPTNKLIVQPMNVVPRRLLLLWQTTTAETL